MELQHYGVKGMRWGKRRGRDAKRAFRRDYKSRVAKADKLIKERTPAISTTKSRKLARGKKRGFGNPNRGVGKDNKRLNVGNVAMRKVMQGKARIRIGMQMGREARKQNPKMAALHNGTALALGSMVAVRMVGNLK